MNEFDAPYDNMLRQRSVLNSIPDSDWIVVCDSCNDEIYDQTEIKLGNYKTYFNFNDWTPIYTPELTAIIPGHETLNAKIYYDHFDNDKKYSKVLFEPCQSFTYNELK